MKTLMPVLFLVAACGSDKEPTVEAAKGPGAALKCSSGKNAFDTYGADAFVAVNEEIVRLVFAEYGTGTPPNTANLGDSFTKIGTGNPPSTVDGAATFGAATGALTGLLTCTFGGEAIVGLTMVCASTVEWNGDATATPRRYLNPSGR